MILGLTGSIGFSETTCREAEIENETPQQLVRLKDKIVVVEGLMWGWGSGWPGLGARIVLPTGQRVYFEGGKFLKDSPNGRTVRVHGHLTLRHMRAAGRHGAGYAKSFDYWTIDDPIVETIDRISTDEVTVFTPPPAKTNIEETEPSGAVQPTAKPADRPPAKGQPSTPTSKDKPQ